ncbi:MAG: DNA translocase FtsK 4TM domain-containing protein [Caldimicrobium sp.]|nr:DNA translocase FtsK 4TM domain-containing protein [Caldimicrobium sp.]
MPSLKRIAWNVFLVLFLIFLTLSLYSFHPQDPGLNILGAEEVRNQMGVLGAYVASIVYFIFGFSSLFLPLFTLLGLFFNYYNLLSLRKVIFLLGSIAISLTLGLSLFFDLIGVKNQYLWKRYPLNGGLIGELTSPLSDLLGVPGLLLFLLTLLILPLFVIFENLNILKRLKELGGNFDGERSEVYQPKILIMEKEKKPFSEEEINKSQVLQDTLQDNLQKDIKKDIRTSSNKNLELKIPPPIELLSEPLIPSHRVKLEELKERALLLKAKLREFGIEGEIVGINPGPVITVFEFKPAPGIKLSKILSLVDDLALGLSAKSVRILAPIPGRNVIGIEISNPHREFVFLKEIFTTEAFQKQISPLTFALGKDISGSPVVADLRKMPHLLIAGSTGSGKSIFIHSIILSFIYKATPDKVRFLMIDPKRIELSVYDGIPYLLHPVVLEPKMATRALRWAVQEMERRYSLFEELEVRNLESYNEEYEEKLPYIVLIIDELADLMVIASKEVETLLTRLAQMARAAGIHLIVATQRPSVDVITGLIKANFPARISFQVTSKVDSRTILDTQGAERLLGAGDMLFMPPGSSHLQRIHAPYVTEREIKGVVEYLKSLGEPSYFADFTQSEEEEIEKSHEEEAFEDELYKEALKIAHQYGKISTSMLQRKLRIGYNRAARLVEKMEEEGIIGPSDGVRPRPVITPRKSS